MNSVSAICKLFDVIESSCPFQGLAFSSKSSGYCAEKRKAQWQDSLSCGLYLRQFLSTWIEAEMKRRNKIICEGIFSSNVTYNVVPWFCRTR